MGGPLKATNTDSKLNSFKRSWDDANHDSKEEKPAPQKNATDGAARRRAAIMAALSNASTGSALSAPTQEHAPKKLKPIQEKRSFVLNDSDLDGRDARDAKVSKESKDSNDPKSFNQPPPDVAKVNNPTSSATPAPLVQRKLRLSNEQQKVLQMVVDESKNVFFTGSAGTGKSVLLREIITSLRKKFKKGPESVAVTASTGIAACNIGGTTLHSFTGCGLCNENVNALTQKVKRNPKALKRWTRVKVLIIDEVSMVDGELFDKLEGLARNIRKRPEPFGNIQIVVCGDFFQLPPVSKGSAPNFCFDAESWTRVIAHTINLRQVFRQRDETFINMLNEMRFGKLSDNSIRIFKSLSRPLVFADQIQPTELYPLRQQVDQSNNGRMNQLEGETKTFSALDSGELPVDQRDKVLSNFMAPKQLHIKLGCQVMLIKNIDETLVNGSLGRVIDFIDAVRYTRGEASKRLEEDEEYDDSVHKARSAALGARKGDPQVSGQPTKKDQGTAYPLVHFLLPNGGYRELLCVPDVWRTEGVNGKIEASRNQVPLILAWSMSIHKSQGQTLERVKVDLSSIFERGQCYVAISRATSLDGLQILGFKPDKVMAHRRVIEWHKTLENV
ncbi:hypothetical protein E3P92_01743 [Wallemia ichthyophaga]|uniref:ATP-dependent DNA helicase PIF1 n=2 Tax=Wallemia ichthyophaga TaxID=245174 RepID=A0A4T0FTW4_WALIC|nr:uncharacterized protein J056_004501 [Wallemia ichthyophaga EXF-994]TIA73762.1 hypothetical protein E3P91_01246 [Wallemia ichthyophaga]EOR01180.1 hypothetical protein J056_004501 [Wallemia ichthyophaga EXF-994]TIA83245.1 hypothetical protein E3P98_00877 [Wallemia ichthyophaga]TIA92202.1 hypothetical protein E3P97_01555 [Wallemia ichthyophaga]TIA99583.1 hypothetical protein E3P95_02002 [Wallemia ichthyophaga]